MKKEHKTKISKYELKEALENNGGKPQTTQSLASQFEVHKQTIRNMVRRLRKEGLPILPTPYGLRLVESVETEKDAIQVIQTGKWMAGESIGLAIIAEALKRPFRQAYKLLPDTMTSEERKNFRNNLLVLKMQADILEIESF